MQLTKNSEKDNFVAPKKNFLALLSSVEIWERFSFYGLQTILILFLVNHLNFTDDIAYKLIALYVALCFAFSAIGGFLIDKFIGTKILVILGGMLILTGHTIMYFVQYNSELIFFALGFISTGSGLFKVSMTTLLGSCYKKGDVKANTGFTIFFMSINIGSTFAAFICPLIAQQYKMYHALTTAGVGMLISLVGFLLLQKSILGTIGSEPSSKSKHKNILGIPSLLFIILLSLAFCFLSSYLLKNSDAVSENILKYLGIPLLLYFIFVVSKSHKKQRVGMIFAAGIILFFCLFFAMEFLIASVINLFCERHITFNILGWNLPSATLQSINPFSIIIISTFFLTFIKEKSIKIYSQIWKMKIALLCPFLCFFLIYIGCKNSETSQISCMYIIIGVSLIGLGEVCIAPFAQSQMVLLAPNHLKGFVMSCLLFSLSYANYFTVLVGKFISINPTDNIQDSLKTYQEGFFKISMIQLVIFAIFIIISFICKKAGYFNIIDKQLVETKST